MSVVMAVLDLGNLHLSHIVLSSSCAIVNTQYYRLDMSEYGFSSFAVPFRIFDLKWRK